MKTFITAILFFASMPVWADTADELLNNAGPDSKADTSQTVSLDAFNGQTVKFFQTLDVDGYYVTGWRGDQLINTPVNALTFGFGTDIRLDRTARAYSSFVLKYPKSKATTSDLYNPYTTPVSISAPTDLVFTSIDVKELFLDYSVGTLAIVRAGRQSATWGQGRLFNPGNLLLGIGDGMAVKITSAIDSVGWTTAFVKNDSLYSVNTTDLEAALGIASLAAATQLEYSSSWFSTGISGLYHRNVGYKGDLYFKTSLLGTDLFVEGLGEWGLQDSKTQKVPAAYTAVAGIYRDFGDQMKWLKLQAEWLNSGRRSDGSFSKVVDHGFSWEDQTLGFAATTDLLNFVFTKPSFMWLHSFADHSGQFVLGFVNTGLPHVELTLGLARVYGGASGRYVKNNPDSEKRDWSFTLKGSFNFDIRL